MDFQNCRLDERNGVDVVVRVFEDTPKVGFRPASAHMERVVPPAHDPIHRHLARSTVVFVTSPVVLEKGLGKRTN